MLILITYYVLYCHCDSTAIVRIHPVHNSATSQRSQTHSQTKPTNFVHNSAYMLLSSIYIQYTITIVVITLEWGNSLQTLSTDRFLSHFPKFVQIRSQFPTYKMRKFIQVKEVFGTVNNNTVTAVPVSANKTKKIFLVKII